MFSKGYLCQPLKFVISQSSGAGKIEKSKQGRRKGKEGNGEPSLMSELVLLQGYQILLWELPWTY